MTQFVAVFLWDRAWGAVWRNFCCWRVQGLDLHLVEGVPCARSRAQLFALAVHLGCELEHEGEGLLLVAAILFGDGEVEGGRVVAVADGMPDFAADALVFEVVDELVGCGVLSRQGAAVRAAKTPMIMRYFVMVVRCVYELAGENCRGSLARLVLFVGAHRRSLRVVCSAFDGGELATGMFGEGNDAGNRCCL